MRRANEENEHIQLSHQTQQQAQNKVPWALQLRLFPVTFSVMGVCVLVYFLSGLLGWRVVLGVLHFPALSDPLYWWQLWRWVTPVFFHFGLMHIVFNVLWWFLLGRIVELRQSSKRLLLVFFASAILPNLAQYLLTGVGFGGLSGVVYGLFGYVWLYGRLRPRSGLFVPAGVMVQIMAWLVLGFTGWLDQWVKMANAAHLGGLVVGLLLAVWVALTTPPEPGISQHSLRR